MQLKKIFVKIRVIFLNKMPLKKLSDLKKKDLQGKKVLLRVDFNVPIENGKIINDKRIRAALPTIDYLLDNGSAVIIATHLGRPSGRIIDDLRTTPLAKKLEGLIKKPIKKVDDCIGKEVLEAKNNLKPGEILVLENTRFHTGEKENVRDFSKQLAEACDLFVQDAFGTVHRGHASTVGVAHFLPSYAGLLVEKEVKVLSEAVKNREHPMVLVTGGAKIETKIGVIRHFLKTADSVLVGGGIANTFLYAQGYEVGESLCEKDRMEQAQEMLAESEEQGGKLKLPIDVIVSKEIAHDAEFFDMPVENVSTSDKILDIGEMSQKMYIEIIKKAKMIIWNGPMGLFEYDIFAGGTKEICKAIANSSAKTIIGGGDTIEAIDRFNIPENKFSHISTGGGAMIEFLEGKVLPGLSVLKE